MSFWLEDFHDRPQLDFPDPSAFSTNDLSSTADDLDINDGSGRLRVTNPEEWLAGFDACTRQERTPAALAAKLLWRVGHKLPPDGGVLVGPSTLRLSPLALSPRVSPGSVLPPPPPGPTVSGRPVTGL